MRTERVVPRLGQKVNLSQAEKGIPPVVFAVQPTHYFKLESPDEIKQWEEDLRNFYGISLDRSGLAGHGCETCSAGCTDDCGLI
jgi:hypothetical protein